jgi:CAAX protease family protein
MNVSENPFEAPTPLPAPAWPVRTRPLAPWWHTILLIVIILGVSFLSFFQSKAPAFAGDHNLKRYLFTIVWEWVLALLAWWGLRMRRTPLREVLGIRRPALRDWFLDLGIALVFWIMAILILAAVATILRLFHLIQPQKVVMALAPQTLPQVLVWFVLCITAGVVEEFVFRGYFLQQFSSLRFTQNPVNNLWIAVLLSSLLFGAGHGYEGIGAMIAITIYGAMFCILTIRRQSLRAGMIAHAWHDSFTGIVLAIAKHMHAL